MVALKRIAPLALVLLLVALLATPVLGAAQPETYLYDEAGLLTAEEQGALYAKAKTVSETLNADVVVLTTDTDHGYTSLRYAEMFFVAANYGTGANRDGIVLYVDMNNREIALFSNGWPDEWLYREDQKIIDNNLKYASQGDYAKALGNILDESLSAALKQNGYKNLSFVQRLAYKLDFELVAKSLGVGAVAAVIVVGILLAMHYTGKPKAPHATMYFGEGGMRTTHAADYFLHTHTTRTEIPRDDSSSSGGGGGSRGGGSSRGGASGKF